MTERPLFCSTDCGDVSSGDCACLAARPADAHPTPAGATRYAVVGGATVPWTTTPCPHCGHRATGSWVDEPWRCRACGRAVLPPREGE